MLTTAQKAVIGVGVSVLGFLGCYLPWTYTLDFGETHSTKPAGYHFVFDPPKPETNHRAAGVRVDVVRAVIPMAVVRQLGVRTGIAWNSIDRAVRILVERGFLSRDPKGRDGVYVLYAIRPDGPLAYPGSLLTPDNDRPPHSEKG